MKVFRFDLKASKVDERFGSVKAIITEVLNLDGKAAVNAVYIRPNESLSHRQAATQQLFLLVEGQGWIESESDKKHAIQAGQAVFWENNEGHETGTETGMTAVIIEGTKIEPTNLMPPLQENEL